MRGLLKTLVLACAVVLVPAIAHAQVGAIAGVVRDASNAVIRGWLREPQSASRRRCDAFDRNYPTLLRRHSVLSLRDLMRSLIERHERLLRRLNEERVTLLDPYPSSY